MACVAIPQQSGRIGQFKGDGEGLVDCLIKACEQRPASSAVSASFGRELVPWTDDTTLGMTLEPLECSGRRSGSMFPATSKTGPKGSPAHKASANKRAKASGSPRSGSPHAAQPVCGKRTSTNGFACPALASAPKPCDLPMPTSGLMSRAILRSRSPSPGKDVAAASFFHPVQVQQLVRPVAA
jgi:hypothetical protein